MTVNFLYTAENNDLFHTLSNSALCPEKNLYIFLFFLNNCVKN